MSDGPDLGEGVEWLKARVVEIRRERTHTQKEILDEIRVALTNTLATAKTDDHLAEAVAARLRYVPAEDVIATLVEWVAAVQADRERLVGMVLHSSRWGLGT